jgi:hypothetical protein
MTRWGELPPRAAQRLKGRAFDRFWRRRRVLFRRLARLALDTISAHEPKLD